MKFNDIRLQEVISLMLLIEQESKKVRAPKITKDQLSEGLRSSLSGSKQEGEVAMSPLMKNALVHYGDFPKESDRRLKTNDPQTKAEKAITSNIKQLLLRFNGKESKFDTNLPLYSVHHYNVQCHQNFKDNMRDIQPGQADARRKMAKVYREPTKQTVDAVINKIKTDPLFQKAISVTLDLTPSVRASDHLREINLPFMNKHSGVGYPYWKNDRTVGPDGKTYAEITMDIAESIKDKPDHWLDYNISTMYGRNQRGKGRFLVATSRVLNLLLNQLEAEEIKSYKLKHPWFIGYGDDQELKRAIIELADYCVQHGLKCANEDYSSYDSTVSTGLVTLLGALSIMKANGARSKKIALKRAIAARKTLLVDGLDNAAFDIFGRIFSGFIDTNRGGGLINGLVMTYQCMKQDKDYTKIVYDSKYSMFVMGDDNLHSYKVLDRDVLAKNMEQDFGMVMNSAKFEFGPVFLQYRVFEDPDSGHKVMAYAWTRVVRSMLMKEESKGLGPVGWTYAWYQQLAKLIEYKPALTIAVNLLAPFDENKFFMNTPIKKLNAMLKAEDDEAYAKLKTDAQKRRWMSTFDKIYDGDPSKQRFAAQDEGYLQQIQDAIRAVYDPGFYNKYGLR